MLVHGRIRRVAMLECHVVHGFIVLEVSRERKKKRGVPDSNRSIHVVLARGDEDPSLAPSPLDEKQHLSERDKWDEVII